MSNESRDGVQEQAREAMRNNRNRHQGRQFILWIGALILGAILGWLGIPVLNQLFDFIATVFTRLFQFIAIPTIALAVITTLSALGAKKETGRIFVHAVTYTLLTTICAAAIGLALYIWIAPGNLPMELISSGVSSVPQKLESVTYYDHFLSVIPNNILQPFLSGNVLSVMLIAAAVGLALAFMPNLGHPRRQPHSVLHRPADFLSHSRLESALRLPQNGSGYRRRIVHQELCRHPAGYPGLG